MEVARGKNLTLLTRVQLQMKMLQVLHSHRNCYLGGAICFGCGFGSQPRVRTLGEHLNWETTVKRGNCAAVNVCMDMYTIALNVAKR